MTVCGTEEYALSDETCLYNQFFLPPGFCVGFFDNNKDIEYHFIFLSFNSVENPRTLFDFKSCFNLDVQATVVSLMKVYSWKNLMGFFFHSCGFV